MIEKLFFIGIDVHKKTCVATIKGRAKKALLQTAFDNDAAGIKRFIETLRRSGYLPAKAIFESTANYWKVLHDELKDAGIDAVLVHPFTIKTIIQAKFKDDKVDSEKLADLGRTDMYTRSFVPDKYHRDLRELTRTRLGIKHDTTTHKNRIHAILAKYPHRQPAGLFTGQGRAWLRIVPVREIDRMALDAHLAILDAMSAQISLLEKEIARVATTDERALLIMTMPGIGPVTAVTVLAELVDHRRFKDPEKLTSYAGLVPSHRNSADTVRTGGITKRGSAWLRNAMVEAAFVAVRFDPRLRARYDRLAAKRGPMKARVAVARQMLEYVWHMLDRNAPYNEQNENLVKRKLQNARRMAQRTL